MADDTTYQQALRELVMSNARHHTTLEGKCEYFSFPSDEDMRQYRVGVQQSPTVTNNNNQLIKVFMGQVGHSFSRSHIAWMAHMITGSNCVVRIEQVGKRREAFTGCCWIYVESEADQEKLLTLCKRVLCDISGFWYARTDEQEEGLKEYVSTAKERGIPAYLRRWVPRDSLVVEKPQPAGNVAKSGHAVRNGRKDDKNGMLGDPSCMGGPGGLPGTPNAMVNMMGMWTTNPMMVNAMMMQQMMAANQGMLPYPTGLGGMGMPGWGPQLMAPPLLCPHGHHLMPKLTPEPGYSCNCCGLTCPENAMMYECRQCDFDACQACYNLHQKGEDTGSQDVASATTTHKEKNAHSGESTSSGSSWSKQPSMSVKVGTPTSINARPFVPQSQSTNSLSGSISSPDRIPAKPKKPASLLGAFQVEGGMGPREDSAHSDMWDGGMPGVGPGSSASLSSPLTLFPQKESIW